MRGRNAYESFRKQSNKQGSALSNLNFDYTPLRSNSPVKEDFKVGAVNITTSN